MFADEELVKSSYLTTFAGALSPQERLALPGERGRRVYFGSDATPRTVGITDFATGQVAVLVWTVELEVAVTESTMLNSCSAADAGRMIIAVKELAGVLLAVAAFGGEHCDSIKIHACDNQSACSWLEHRRADNEFVQAMLDQIGRLEVACKLQLFVPYVHTERNKWNDLLTRLEVDRRALEAETATAPGDVSVHEATYRWEDTDALSILLEVSKTDQDRRGCTRTVYASDTDSGLCVGEAYKQLRRLQGAAYDSAGPLLQTPRGKMASRTAVSDSIKRTATKLRCEPGDYAAHSLRIGGVTTLFYAGVDHEEVRRFGRWASDCWRRYVYESRESTKYFARKMATSVCTMQMLMSDYLAATSSRFNPASAPGAA